MNSNNRHKKNSISSFENKYYNKYNSDSQSDSSKSKKTERKSNNYIKGEKGSRGED